MNSRNGNSRANDIDGMRDEVFALGRMPLLVDEIKETLMPAARNLERKLDARAVANNEAREAVIEFAAALESVRNVAKSRVAVASRNTQQTRYDRNAA